MRKRLLLSLGVVGAVAVLAASEACRSATQVTLVVDSRIACDELGDVVIVVGSDPHKVESDVGRHFYTAQTSTCEGGRVGTLVITPGDDSARGAVAVIAALEGADPRTCTEENGYFGCVVARRVFSFVEYAGLTLPVSLDPDCLNVPCNAISTCRSGSCVSSEVQCTGDGCSEPGALADGGVALVDAPTNNDAATPDATHDAPIDAPADVSTDGALFGQPMPCPPRSSEVPCDPQEVCCIYIGDPAPARNCVAPQACGDTPMRCAGAVHCPQGQICCVDPGPGLFGSVCKTGPCATNQLCTTHAECLVGSCTGAWGASLNTMCQ